MRFVNPWLEMMTINVLCYVTTIDKIDSNGAVQNFTYCTEKLFYLKK